MLSMTYAYAGNKDICTYMYGCNKVLVIVQVCKEFKYFGHLNGFVENRRIGNYTLDIYIIISAKTSRDYQSCNSFVLLKEFTQTTQLKV